MTFSDLNLCAPVLKAVRAAGYENPTPIQEQAIPLVLAGRDIFGSAQTGTGKTAAFALPILTRLEQEGPRRDGPRVLVLAPTRELAAQIGESFLEYGRQVRARYVTVYGGVSIRPQMMALRKGADVVIATPGRLIDLFEQRAIHLDRIQTLVLDEADHMMDLGFLPQIHRIVDELPKQRQTLMFSATLPAQIKSLANNLLNNPEHIAVTPVSSAVETVGQELYHVDKDKKKDLLVHLLNEKLEGSVLVFTRTKRGADRVQKDLERSGISAAAIHGEKSQNARNQALKDFKNQRVRVLVATDVASRGLDIDQLPYVINYDITDTPETYVHRIGRTGRAGMSGTALLLATREEVGAVRAIEKLMKRSIDIITDHPFAITVNNSFFSEGGGSRGGGRNRGGGGGRRGSYGGGGGGGRSSSYGGRSRGSGEQRSGERAARYQ